MSITSEMAQKYGAKPVVRVQITTTSGTTDISSYLKGGAYLESEKSRLPDEIALVSVGDIMLTFSNNDDKFTENDASSVFYGVVYHGAKIDIDVGYNKDDGTTEYANQAVLKIINVELSSDNSECMISCRDIMADVVNFIVNVPPYALLPVANAANTGNGYMSEVETLPFVMVTENWTLTCTTLGGDSVAIFDVVGSVSGDIGDATSGTEFSNSASGGIRFTIHAGGTDWAVGDIFTFSTRQTPEWTATNPIKIIYSLLTGYNYDTDTAEDWLTATPQLDHTQGAGNTDIDFASFQAAVTALGTGFNLTGYIRYNKSLSEALKEIMLHFLGYLYVNEESKVYTNIYAPSIGSGTLTDLADTKKISSLRYKKNLDNVINACTARYKKTAAWAWSGDTETYDGKYTNTNATSITNYGERALAIDSIWLSVNDQAIQWAVDRLVDKYNQPPLDLDVQTGLDALTVQLGDFITVNDTKTSLTNKIMEVYRLSKDFSNKPMHITVSCDDTQTTGIANWCFLGSIADEGDGLSPQASDYDSATASDKQFCYLSQTGGAGSDPEYYLW